MTDFISNTGPYGPLHWSLDDLNIFSIQTVQLMVKPYEIGYEQNS